MRRVEILFDPQALRKVRVAPAAAALDRKLVSKVDLLRLKAIARLQARGLPPDVGWSDLLQEAFARVLDGARKPPEGVSVVAFFAGVMRSIKSEHCRRARRQASRLPKMLADLESDGDDAEPRDPTPNPERKLAVMQELARIDQLFADDLRARQVIEGLYEGCSPEQICARYEISTTEYDSTRKRMRRALLRDGLRNIDEW